MSLRRLLHAFITLAAVTTVAQAQNAPCEFDPAVLQFKGSPVEQARCLLRPNRIGGVLAGPLRSLPAPLGKIIGKPTGISKESLLKYLDRKGIRTDDVGGDLSLALAGARTPDGVSVPALYFVIHDTSYPYFADAPFPQGFDSDGSWKGNDLSIWTKQPVAHVFVNRIGQSVTTTPFSAPVTKGFGTKFARDILKAENKGLKLHIELIQPRRRDASNPDPKNDRIAPEPGFTPAQYERLALLYLTASVRRGSWLIPGYHSAYDAGIKGAHDDPQNFSLNDFAAALSRLIKAIR